MTRWWQAMRTWLRRLNPANDPPFQRQHMPEKHALAAEQLRIGADLAQLRAEHRARLQALDAQADVYRREGEHVADG